MDTDDSWLLLAFPVCLVLSAFFSSVESDLIALPNAGSNLVTHFVYSG